MHVLIAISAGGHAMRRSIAEVVAVGVKAGHTLRALAPESEARDLRSLGIPIESWRPVGPFNVLRSIGALRRAVERFEPDVVVAFGWTASTVALGTLPPRFAAKTMVVLEDPIREAEMPKAFVEKRLPELLGRAGLVWCAYPTLVRGLVNGLGIAADHVELVTPGVAPVCLPGLARAPGRKGPILGYLGRLDAERAWEVALDALAKLVPTHPDARLWFANTGRVEGLVRAHARSLHVLDAVTFYENLPTAEFLLGIDLLLVPRMVDGLPYALMEGLVNGIPVVAADDAGLRDTLSPFAGYLVPDTAEGFAAGITTAWNEIDHAWERAAEQRARASETFDPEAVSQRLLAAWDRLASENAVASR